MSYLPGYRFLLDSTKSLLLDRHDSNPNVRLSEEERSERVNLIATLSRQLDILDKAIQSAYRKADETRDVNGRHYIDNRLKHIKQQTQLVMDRKYDRVRHNSDILHTELLTEEQLNDFASVAITLAMLAIFWPIAPVAWTYTFRPIEMNEGGSIRNSSLLFSAATLALFGVLVWKSVEDNPYIGITYPVISLFVGITLVATHSPLGSIYTRRLVTRESGVDTESLLLPNTFDFNQLKRAVELALFDESDIDVLRGRSGNVLSRRSPDSDRDSEIIMDAATPFGLTMGSRIAP